MIQKTELTENYKATEKKNSGEFLLLLSFAGGDRIYRERRID